ncbi:MAG TPA: acyltransferase [Parvibaculum sp.]
MANRGILRGVVETRGGTVVAQREFSSVQALRAIAALSVVAWHSSLTIKNLTYTYWHPEQYPGVWPWWSLPFSHLYAGVDIFFVISGFIMTMIASELDRGGARRFFIDRLVRIVPPYWFFTAAVMIAYLLDPGFNLGKFGPDTLGNLERIASSLFFVPQDSPVLPVGWTLVHEMLFYGVTSVAIWFGLARRLPMVLAVIVAIALAQFFTGTAVGNGVLFSPFYIEFLFGALTYTHIDAISHRRPAMQIALGTALFFATSILLSYGLLPELGRFVAFGGVGVLLISGLTGLEPQLRREGSSFFDLLVRIGGASYTLYLSHWLVLSAAGKVGAMAFKSAPLFVVIVWQMSGIVLAVAFSLIFYRTVELPVHRWLKSRMGRSVRAAGTGGEQGAIAN